MLKRCSVCKQDLPSERFHNSAKSKDGKSYRCKTCDYSAQKRHKKERYLEFREGRRKVQRKHKYGLDDEQFNKMLESQGGLCACCGKILEDGWAQNHKPNKLVVDHDHVTGQVRGLLCTMCNKGLGLLGDNIEGLEKALAYLKKCKETY